MEKFQSLDLGPIQLKKVQECFRDMKWEAKAKVQLTNHLENGEVKESRAKLVGVFDNPSEAYAEEYQRLFVLFNGTVSRENLQSFLDEAKKSIEAIKQRTPVDDQRRTKEELEEQEREFKARIEEQNKKQEAFTAASVEIPAGKMGICLDVCFDDSDMQTDYYAPHRQIESRLLAIVKKQPETERLARSIVSRILDLKEIEFEWKTEKWSMGHGNYLEAKKSHETRKHEKYFGHADCPSREEDVPCFYEVTFTGYGREIPHEKYYLGDLTEIKQNPGEQVNGKTIRENTEKNGVELIFNEKPTEEVLTLLKANGWRWSRFNRLWYNKLTEENLAFARSL